MHKILKIAEKDKQNLMIIIIFLFIPQVLLLLFGLQCFDAVGWAAGRASGL